MEPTKTQQEIISQEGNVVVMATPGSGKTFVMSEKIKRLLLKDEMRDYQGVIAICKRPNLGPGRIWLR